MAFVMTINKSQGQTLNNVGVYLPSLVFYHGQMYVVISRDTSSANIKIFNGQGLDEYM
jgi:ATP-dependent exoDNAse (exonuclease V) alpha subunit